MKLTFLVAVILFAQISYAGNLSKRDQDVMDFATEYYTQSTVMQSYPHLQALLNTAFQEAHMVNTDPDGDAARLAEIEHYQVLQQVYLAHPDHKLQSLEESKAIFAALLQSCDLGSRGGSHLLLNDFERAAICLYTKSEYEKILPAMDNRTQTFAHIISHIDSALAKLPQEHGTVERYVKMSEAALKNLQPGSIFARRSYTSTSRGGAKYLASISNVEMHILVKRGADISKYSFLSVENEVLLPRDSKFKVISVVKRNDGKWQLGLEQL
jgi:hypothetical protein